MQDRAAFDELNKGTSKAADLPYIGLFNDGRLTISSHLLNIYLRLG